MPLRKRLKRDQDMFRRGGAGGGGGDGGSGEEEGRKKRMKKRDRIVDFFRLRKRRHLVGVRDDQSTPAKATPSPPRLQSSGPQTPQQGKEKKEKSPVEIARSSTELLESPLFQKQRNRVPTPPQNMKELEAKPREPEVVKFNFTEDQLHALFAGAPHFSVQRRKDSVEPTVSFPWDSAELQKDVSDVVPFSHPAFTLSTLRSPGSSETESTEDPTEVYHDLDYDIGVYEIPSMLSMEGIEPGTVGFQHFLQIPISDALAVNTGQSLTAQAALNKERLQQYPEKLGIRPINLLLVYQRLVEFGDFWTKFQKSPRRMTILEIQGIGDLYAHLFAKFLTPPRFDPDTTDPTGLKVQIECLITVLNVEGIWYDFSLVEWRIRIGQLLLGEPPDASGEAIENLLSPPLWSERNVLLLQLLLSCELLLRLDAASDLTEHRRDSLGLTSNDMDRFRQLEDHKVHWDLAVAKRFLENVIAVVHTSQPSTPKKQRKLRDMLTWRAREDEPKLPPRQDLIFCPRHEKRQLSGLFHFANTLEWPDMESVAEDLSLKLGRVSEENHVAELTELLTTQFKLASSRTTPTSIYGTPLATPKSGDSMRTSYFGKFSVNRPTLSRRSTERSLNIPLSPALLTDLPSVGIGGWLSRAYLTGLILPGEAICHLLMSTLLENDNDAIEALGDIASLYGGFVYKDRTYWSKSCVVGKVLAALENAVECMGWICIPRLPNDCVEGWYTVRSEEVRGDFRRVLNKTDIVATQSAPVLNNMITDAHPEDFILALDPPVLPDPFIRFDGWSLTPGSLKHDDSAGVSDIESVRAFVGFKTIDHEFGYVVPLRHDVFFVPSFPCSPPSSPLAQLPFYHSLAKDGSSSRPSSSDRSVGSKIPIAVGSPCKRPVYKGSGSHGFDPLKSHPPNSKSQEPRRVPSLDPFGPSARRTKDDKAAAAFAEQPLAHPLRVSYKYKVVPAGQVTEMNFLANFRREMSPNKASRHAGKNEPRRSGSENDRENSGSSTSSRSSTEIEPPKEIVVLDARGNPDLELFARAWCSEVGLNALIGRVGRTCLSCCVREARALGIRVVIRVGE